jgi:hypothetical protein
MSIDFNQENKRHRPFESKRFVFSASDLVFQLRRNGCRALTLSGFQECSFPELVCELREEDNIVRHMTSKKLKFPTVCQDKESRDIIMHEIPE